MNKLFPLMNLLIILFILGCAEEPPSSITEFTAIGGTVKNLHGNPLEGVEVRANNKESYTDSAGYFVLNNLKKGEWRLYLYKKGYQGDSSTYIEVNKKEMIKMNFTLIQLGGIYGTVKNSNGEVIVRAEISTQPVSIKTYTNENGYYELTGLEEGEYSIYAVKGGYIKDSLTINVYNELLSNANFFLLTRGGINGTVTNSSEDPLEGVKITTEPATSVVYTNPNGYYEITDIDAGSYTIYAFEDGYFQLSRPVEVANEQIINVGIVLIGTDKFNIEMSYVQGGSFQMGDTFGNGDSDELPVHTITLNDYYIGKYEVTNVQYAGFLNSEGNQTEGGVTWLDINDSDCRIEYSGGEYKPETGYENHPIMEVTWYGARAYCGWFGGRLPTEAEWEYAARGGILSYGYKYSGSDNINDVAWYNINSGGTTHIVGTKNPNELGIYDMSGNVWEWCNDWYDGSYYNISPTNNPQGPSSGNSRVLRGGSWRPYLVLSGF
ncbi:SUMF1/EgtB/PvdO family nonheme iron enzyme [Bacteroidota bacterium]